MFDCKAVRQLATGAAAWLLLFGPALRSAPAQETPASAPAPAETPLSAPLTAAQVVERLVAMNQQRAEALKGYSATRLYRLEFHGSVDRRAEMLVKMTYQWPYQKEFQIVSESGSEFLRRRVLERLVDAEVEAMQKDNRERTAVSPQNYDFRLVGFERTRQRQFYVLEATPKVENKYLFRGRIWVDGQDFAIVRMEGEPAKSPSWWTVRNDIRHSYKKVGDFWLPARNETVTQVRMFGQSFLTIEYKDYELTPARSVQTQATTEAPPVTMLQGSN